MNVRRAWPESTMGSDLRTDALVIDPSQPSDLGIHDLDIAHALVQ